MKARHHKTLALIFSRPTPSGVKWSDAVALFVELGAEITEREGSRVAAKKRSNAMKNIMLIGGQQAVIAYDPDIEMFRGEFIGLNGDADFYAADVTGLHREGELSLAAFMDECANRGIEPRKSFSGKFVLRVDPEIHQAAAIAAAASGESLNQWVSGAIKEAANA